MKSTACAGTSSTTSTETSSADDARGTTPDRVACILGGSRSDWTPWRDAGIVFNTGVVLAGAAQDQLDQWLEYVLRGAEPEPHPYSKFSFPSNEVAELYLSRVAAEAEPDVRRVLRHLLLPSCSLGADTQRLEFLAAGGWRGLLGEEVFQKEKHRLDNRRTERDRRLVAWARNPEKNAPPWEGITWVLDLLPEFPQQALDALGAYILAHAQALPDARFAALSDALDVVRARYVGMPGDDVGARVAALLRLPPRSFERLIERYLAADGYSTELTAPAHDGGRDVIARRSQPPPVQHVLVECKNRSKRVGVRAVRNLLGAVTAEKATHGMLVATSGFTKPAVDFAAENPRASLLGHDALVRELNRRLGTTWPAHIERRIVESQMHCP